MNLAFLKGFVAYMQDMRRMLCFKRKGNNLFMLVCEDKNRQRETFYFDLTRQQSSIFTSEGQILGEEFCAPFDLKLASLNGAMIEELRLDGENRILQFLLLQKESYKMRHFYLVCEFTGKHTNVILCDKHWVVIEALRHIPRHKSWREVRIGQVLKPLPQPALKQTNAPLGFEELSFALRENYKKSYQKSRQAKKEQILHILRLKRSSLSHALSSLPCYDKLLEHAALYAHYGELIFGSLHLLSTHKITSSSLILQDGNAKVEIPLPQNMRDLQEVGNWYFTQSKKYRKRALHLDIQIENLQDKIDFIDKQIALIERFDDLSEPFSQALKNKRTKSTEALYINGFKVSIGRNAKDNQRLLALAKADDIWLHIRDVPSAHGIIHCGKQMPSSDTLQKVAEILIGLYVQRKGVGDFVVDWTRRRFVKPASGGKVSYAKHKSISYRVQSGNALRLLET
ncbi:NFACT family protein [Helicobacter marmotae]|uniref:DUF814 domain-containing protein n=1 Tax=Helicobacter marmotae TaxID=152490 RepID=A0A3D8I550_9HELI|nr:NFACT family protein [Helicobacter marmotae]RDU60258.1 DUF814 domain-containing protein [Helicobacter marmotae]